jgi:acyl transferase domain-containing protein
MNRGWAAHIVLGLMLIAAGAGNAQQKSSLDSLLEQADQLDKAEFDSALDKADSCTRRRDFPCSDSALAKAAKLASGKDKQALAAGRERLAKERLAQAEEVRIAEARRQAERRRLEQEREEEEREQRRIAAEERAQSEADARAATSAAYADMINQNNRILAEGARRLQQANNDIAAGVARAQQVQAQQAAERQRAADIQAEQRRQNQREREQRQLLAANQAAEESRAEQRRQREATAERERADQRRQDQERERQRLAAAEQERAERARQAEAERNRQAQQKSERLAAEQQEKSTYLTAMRNGIRLVATKCPDGEGHYYATGVLPKVKPRGDMCIDVHYEASCADGRATVSGVADNFIGMSGCFGDTYKISPKPACAVEQVRIRVTSVTPGCNG